MLDDSETPPNKRRRIGHPPTLDEIAQSNKTLQYLSGRQNRWMTGAIETNGVEQTRAATDPAVRGTAAATNSIAWASNANTTSTHPEVQYVGAASTAPSANGSIGQVTSGLREQERPRPASSTAQRTQAPSLVQYESPMTEASAASNTSTTNARKSMDAMSRTGQPSLPSPAPSDESPRLSASHSRNPTEVAGGTNVRSMANSPIAMNQPSLLQQPVPQQLTMPGQPAHQQYMRQQMGYPLQAMQAQTAPQHSHQPRRSTSGSVQLQQQPFVVTNSHAPSQTVRTPPVVPSNFPPAQQFSASRIPQQALMQRLNAKEIQMGTALSATDSGRLVLLRDAVRQGDWFYQMLSQLFCLRTVNPGLLPQSIRNLNNRSWEYLNILLCPNTEVTPSVVKFFSDFPENIMDIYSDQANAREIYEMRVHAVKAFLNKLPSHWDAIVTKCKEIYAPPLVQDLNEILNLQSVVLQSTAFRAIARMIYGNSEQDAKGLMIMEQLHQIDQETFYYQAYRRNGAEKRDAYNMFQCVYQIWKQHQRRHARDQHFPDFPPPPVAFEYFRRMPQSMLPASSTAAAPQIQQQPQQQQTPRQFLQQSNRFTQAMPPNGRTSPASNQTAQIALQQQRMQMIAQGRNPQALNALHSGMQNPMPTARQSKLLFPRVHEQPRAQPTHPEWTRSGIHQSHLRSPVLGEKELKLDSPRLYRHVIGFSVAPTSMKKGMHAQTIAFNVTKESMDRIARTDPPSAKGEPGSCNIEEGSLLYRLRCSVLPKGGYSSESAWVTADNNWPEEMYFELNGEKLDTRRKLHHGRYLPIDLTRLIQLGENKLIVLRNRNENDVRSGQYALAVEVIGVMGHEAINKQVRHISAEESLGAIKKSLSGNDDGDDELAVTSGNLTIKLFDPYSGCKIFDLPVRGAKCLHRDCFDLETFLSVCKRQHPGWPTVVDCWRCPLCRGDVRPQELIVDEFLVNVRKELESQGLLETRAIVVDANGTWKPKEEERSGVRSPSLEREEQRRLATSIAAAAAPKKVLEIIELD